MATRPTVLFDCRQGGHHQQESLPVIASDLMEHSCLLRLPDYSEEFVPGGCECEYQQHNIIIIIIIRPKIIYYHKRTQTTEQTTGSSKSVLYRNKKRAEGNKPIGQTVYSVYTNICCTKRFTTIENNNHLACGINN